MDATVEGDVGASVGGTAVGALVGSGVSLGTAVCVGVGVAVCVGVAVGVAIGIGMGISVGRAASVAMDATSTVASTSGVDEVSPQAANRRLIIDRKSKNRFTSSPSATVEAAQRLVSPAAVISKTPLLTTTKFTQIATAYPRRRRSGANGVSLPPQIEIK